MMDSSSPGHRRGPPGTIQLVARLAGGLEASLRGLHPGCGRAGLERAPFPLYVVVSSQGLPKRPSSQNAIRLLTRQLPWTVEEGASPLEGFARNWPGVLCFPPY